MRNNCKRLTAYDELDLSVQGGGVATVMNEVKVFMTVAPVPIVNRVDLWEPWV